METQPLSEEPSKVDPEPAASQPVPENEAATRQQNVYVDGLKAVIGASGGPLENAINEFLSGKGELHETASAAVTRGGDSAVGDVGSVLEKQFDLNPAIAKLVASLLVKLVPSLKETKKAKPRRKPKTASSAKKETSAKKKVKPKTPAAKKKTASKTSTKTTASKAKPKKKTSAVKPAAKKKTAVKKAKKATTTKRKTKKATRSGSIDVSG
jgi:hypothetical protein